MPDNGDVLPSSYPNESDTTRNNGAHDHLHPRSSESSHSSLESGDSGVESQESVESMESQSSQDEDMEDVSNPNSIADIIRVSTRDLPNNPTRAGTLLLRMALHRFFTFPREWPISIPKLDLARNGFFLNSTQDAVQCYFCNVKILRNSNYSTINEVDAAHRQLSPNCELMVNPNGSENIPISDTSSYRYEAHRLFSLLNTNWTAPVDLYDLAKSGFYWTGSTDNCRCAFCRLEVRGWEPGDTADGEHRRWNSSCVFLNGRTVGNIKIGEELQPLPLMNDEAGFTPRSNFNINPFARSENGPAFSNKIKYLTVNSRQMPMEYLGVTPINPPRHPEYMTLQKRIDSYKLWPLCMPQRPEELSESGFYYTGAGDRVICFQCGGGLKDWAENDKPWEEHAKWFSKCPYLMLKKGADFISNATKNKKEMPIEAAVQAAKAAQAAKNVYDMSKVDNSKGAPVSKPLEMCGSKDISDKPLPPGSLLCRLCRKKDIQTVYLPCGHMVSCMDCVEKEDKCRSCFKPRVAYVRTFLQ